MKRNIILASDSYKTSHYLQYPEGTTTVFSYIEARNEEYEHAVFAGIQGFIKEYLLTPITEEDLVEADIICKAHGVPFNYDGWKYIIENHNGYIPVKIKALEEGTIVPVRVPMVTIENTDPKCFWVTSYVETALLRAIWYPTTVATISYNVKQIIKQYFEETVDDKDQGNIMFKLHDFGARGVSSSESAAIGGFAHLINFMGTDTLEAIRYAKQYYNADMAGFSIPAAEHSTITMWGKDREADAYANMLEVYGGKGKLLAVVSDSYDIYNACENIWGDKLRDQVRNMGGTLVIRPDSGDPVEVTLKVIEILGRQFGYTINEKGYKILNPCIRIIQGDGVNPESIKAILENYKQNGWSADNIAFGMGGALLQKVNRDTLGFAMKASYAVVNGFPRDVFKDPITDKGKKSKKGKIKPYRYEGKWVTIMDIGWNDYDGTYFEAVYENGQLIKETTLDEIRERANATPFPRQK